MSRIGKKIIQIPSGVQISAVADGVRVKGPKGELTVALPQGIGTEISESALTATRSDDSNNQRAMHGLSRALLANAVTGVSEGFVRKLDVVGIGYRAEVRGKYLSLTLGHSHPVEMPVPEDLEISVAREQRAISNYIATISIGGIDRYRVGQVAADIRSLRPPDAYKGKGIRYSDEVVRTKVGKKGA